MRDESIDPDFEQNQDALLQSLTRVGSVSADVDQYKVTKERRFLSRFFIRLNPSAEDFVSEQQQSLAMTRSIADDIRNFVDDRAAKYNGEFPIPLDSNIVLVREFILNEINPWIMGSSVGAAQAKDVTQQTLGVNVDGAPYMHLDTMMRRAIKLRIAKFVSKHLKVPVSELLKGEPPKEVIINGQTNSSGQSTERSTKTVSRSVPRERQFRNPASRGARR